MVTTILMVNKIREQDLKQSDNKLSEICDRYE